MLTPPTKGLSERKFTLWVIVILVFLTFQFVLTFTGHKVLDNAIGNVMVAESARQCTITADQR
jgi:hypothetical protein